MCAKSRAASRNACEVFKANKLDALIAIGGDDTQSVTNALVEAGVPGVGVPKTIDNDLNGTDVCFGFDTAVMIATEAVDRLHTTAESHSRVIVCEVMGRDAGWIALTAGVAGGAHVILVPEKPIDLDHVCAIPEAQPRPRQEVRHRRRGRRRQAARCPADRPRRAPRSTPSDTRASAASAKRLAEEIEKRTGYETRSVNLGHTQRGGTPTAYDRMLATRYGLAAIDLVHQGKFGRLVVLHGTKIEDIPLAEAIAKNRTVDDSFLSIISSLEPKL